MLVLLVSDLHYDLRKLDWVVTQAPEYDVVVLAGDLLNIASPVPLDAQITVLLAYLAKMSESARVVVCSGNHDLDHRGESGEKETRWLAEAKPSGVVVDGDSTRIGDWLLTACRWWEGPVTLSHLEAALDEAAQDRPKNWLWAFHGPPAGPLAWTGSTSFPDPELPRLLDLHRPDVVLCGHIHQAPFTADGSWHDRYGPTWLFNAGHQLGAIPSHVTLDLAAGSASWWSYEGSQTLALQ